MNPKKVLDIFESNYTDQLYDRKANFIVKLCKERKDGFNYYEIEDISKLVKYAVNDLNQGIVKSSHNNINT